MSNSSFPQSVPVIPRSEPTHRQERLSISGLQDLPSILRKVTGLMLFWSDRARQRRYLGRLDARLLRDIGVSRPDALREAGRPFWDGNSSVMEINPRRGRNPETAGGLLHRRARW